MKAARIPLFLSLVGSMLIGCHAQTTRANADGKKLSDAPEPIIQYTPGRYDEAFDAVRDVLSEFRFAIDRVDARRGVITTHPKRSAGLGTPWDREQSTLTQEWEDLINEQRRVVRVEFEQGEESSNQARVRVEVLRTHRPNWRVQSESVRLSTHARSRDVNGELEPGSYLEPVGLDTALAWRLAAAINDRLRGAADAP